MVQRVIDFNSDGTNFLDMIALKLALKSLKFNNWLNRENNAFVRIYGKLDFGLIVD